MTLSIGRLLTLALGTTIALGSSGCATYEAFTSPRPTNDQLVEVGMHRSTIEGILRTSGQSYDEPNGTTRAHYAYSDGGHPGWRARGVIYLAADVFTLFLSEIIFWPIELAVDSSAERTADAVYDETNELVYFNVTKAYDRKQLIEIGSVPPVVASGAATQQAFLLEEERGGSEFGVEEEETSSDVAEGSMLEFDAETADGLGDSDGAEVSDGLLDLDVAETEDRLGDSDGAEVSDGLLDLDVAATADGLDESEGARPLEDMESTPETLDASDVFPEEGGLN